MIVLFTSVIASVLAIRRFERRYPLGDGTTSSTGYSNQGQQSEQSEEEAAVAVDARGAGEEVDGQSAGAVVAGAEVPPPWLDRLMGLVYPGSLGLDGE